MNDLFKFSEERKLLILSSSDLEIAIRNVVTELFQKKEEEKTNARLTRKAVRERLNVDNSTLWRWDKTGYLRAIHVGRAVYYLESDVKNLEEGRL